MSSPDDRIVADASTGSTGSRGWGVAFILMGATLVSTLLVGAGHSDAYRRLRALGSLFGHAHEAVVPPPWSLSTVWVAAISFSLSLLLILLAHELGHYVLARRHRVDVSPPWFIPSVAPFGTLGAVISLRVEKIRSGPLMQIAAMGPIAGMVVAVPVLVVGMALSEVRPLPENLEDVSQLGLCLLMLGLERLFFPDVPHGHDVFLHPMAFAGWAGCFVTAFNLFPIGQLDGGHVAYALFGERYNRWVWLPFGGLIVLGLLVYFPWLFLAALLVALVGVRHPPMLIGATVTGRDRWLGWIALGLFVVTFTPRPFELPGALMAW